MFGRYTHEHTLNHYMKPVINPHSKVLASGLAVFSAMALTAFGQQLPDPLLYYSFDVEAAQDRPTGMYADHAVRVLPDRRHRSDVPSFVCRVERVVCGVHIVDLRHATRR